MAKPATVRFYVDADILGLAKLLASIRSDVTYPGDPGGTVYRRTRPPCPITTPHTDDELWLPETARHGWLVITRDSNIVSHTAEINAVRRHGARMIALSGHEAVDTFTQLEIIMCQWRAIAKRLEYSGPFIDTAWRTTLSRIPGSDTPLAE